ncbi:DNA sulfur modification protein DndB [Haloimpatiens massiliensis]|uniref:DNA sulfur modification protein DndB n=1 Tax=Haloimpatiens massiliensis TaxID=1658110 RepID=UPI000C84169E|nr:DNA sulfur modification protein DndB [Haloimpatiens massiliensis]
MNKTKKYDFTKEERTTIKKDVNGYRLPVQIYRQGKRCVYRAVMSFGDVKRHLTHTKPKPDNHELLLADIESITNRYLMPKKAKDIMKYIQENEEDFILPSLTVMAKEEFEFIPIYPSINEIKKVFGQEFDVKSLRYKIFDVIELFNGVLFGEIIIPFNTTVHEDEKILFETGDGNHRTYAIHELYKILGEDNPGFYIGVDFYVEKNKDKIRDIFVDLNNQTPIDRSIYTLLKGRDPLSLATKDLVGLTKKTYMVSQLYHQDLHYIGFSPLDNIGPNSKATISFNMLKNMISYIALGVGDADKPFADKFAINKTGYSRLLRQTSAYLKTIFEYVGPFKEIKGELNKIPKLRNEYISLTGAGLYVIAKIGYIAREQNLDMRKVALALSELDWKRQTDEGTLNSLFIGGVLNENGQISNNRNSINATTEKLIKYLNIPVSNNKVEKE